MKKNKVLLIGWDAADWKFLTPLLDEGLMPNLKRLMDAGATGRLATLDPPLSPTLWTSIATGKRPYKHGIHGFTEVDPSGEGIRPIYSTNRKVKAIWNILTQHKLKTHVVGWWPSHPAEPINGTMISNFYQRAKGAVNEPWPMLSGTVYPKEKSKLFADLRIHPHELTGNHIEPFVPDFEKVNQSIDNRLVSVAKVTAECSSIHAATTYIMENEEWDFLAVYYDAIDHYCHGFMKYNPPKRDHINLRDYEMYKGVVNAGCRYHDMMLGRLLELAGEDTTVLLVSDHGFFPHNNRPKQIPKEPAGPALEHSPFGIIVAKGEGIKQGQYISGASLLDITPTILKLFDLPVAEDMDGKVLNALFENTEPIKTIKSWENIKGDDGSHPKNFEVNAEDARAELQQLIELGYVEDPEVNGDDAVAKTKNENNFNLARSYIDGGEWKEGIKLLATLHKDHPSVLHYATRLVTAYLNTSQFKDARKICNTTRELLTRENSQFDMLEASVLIAEGRSKKALILLQKVIAEAGEMPQINLRIAQVYLRLNRLSEAKIAAKRELEINSEDVYAHYTLGLVHYHALEYELALESFYQAVDLMYYFQEAHFQIGETLLAMQEYEKAITAYDNCLNIAPAMNIARDRIINLYESQLALPGKALKYKKDFYDNIKGTINIVSGLPRSGTSLMMQMLDAGGQKIFTDKEREPDESNPKGYYEHEAVKSLRRSHKFLNNAMGQTVKVIAHLLIALPQKYRYRIVFMEREITEVIISQQKMIARNNTSKNKPDVLSLSLMKKYEQTLMNTKKWIADQPNVEAIFVNYVDLIKEPFPQAMRINDFFDGTLEVEKMASKVDQSLYREKSN